ncbi:MAG: 1-deoxy-D-xylulose-5-phosphate reductoisomerase [Deltaproteobacteria bacterium RIFCSPLOWO2_12_FULL_40_28]|nr:MAG: 1-deoxy-D-xylulose-5-phosphate reductoisomerase [Deltaproteobacteria bacterium RIFCSPHIGHO2_02_FULL_40_28]OGQ18958.1 MAG: 1-deoxy-D-xylulose-5-phosphate reductoisomerase [Deltaproteobacteria bacterium RIFCSPHIGHO2_12_FULL_40_32]OGQ39501.1 MAG: 1-deoxy-D-xylulose-5-phosphate reductoisomerase [Deltaproteobacteria bacterium RIFCSPLOWO2_02_FULL_40_36]OGQ53391.1 MAG: 1-deoxy-D-xylulose-5-phosphate reductoisomerase [Deltaproteobacteria bacterium RIFCSPLOWO2_12_FULL_40_28]
MVVKKKKIVILGSTGSVGQSTLDLVRCHPDRFEIFGLVAGSKIDALITQIKEFKPHMVALATKVDAEKLVSQFQGDIEVLHGPEGASQIVTHASVDFVMSAIVGAAGLLPTLAAAKAGKVIGLANKESMVVAGELVTKEAKKSGSFIIPVDSEHSALYQCLAGQRIEDVKNLILTASGGPFFKLPQEEFASITVERALKHPNWDMGPKITIDSATMMNKGLEVMEARWLFDVPVAKIKICVHPQSIIHSMVEYKDGSVLAQLGVPDMRVPIAYALAYPERITTGAKPLKLTDYRELNFFEPDFEKFKSLAIAYRVAERGETYPAVLNAANEVAVAAFLSHKIKFVDIPLLVEKTLDQHKSFVLSSLDDVLKADAWARKITQENI